MRLAWIDLRDFRSYHRLQFRPADAINLLVGPNGAGKTNLLEAVGYLSSLSSFRRVPERTLVREGAGGMVLRGEVERQSNSMLVEVELPKEGRRRAQLNRQAVRRGSDLLGKVRAVAFLPDDLDVVKRGPSLRRAFLDDVAVQLWPSAHLDQVEYERALRHRNALLKQWGRRVDEQALEVWDERLAGAGARVMARRGAVAETLLPRVRSLYRRLAGESGVAELEYRCEWGGSLHLSEAESLRYLVKALGEARSEDLERGVTTAGPHRDDPAFLVDGKDAKTLASQGEQRSLVLALRLASHLVIGEHIGEAPLLLLDDVFSELDERRSAALVALLPPAQTFVTSARRDEIPLEGREWAVAGGTIR